MSSEVTLIKTLTVANTLGEGVVWNDKDQSVWWTDIQESLIFRYHLASDKIKIWSLPERLSAFAFTRDPDWLICAFASGFALYNLVLNETRWLAKPEQHLKHTRLNDGKVDRQGRFWAGSMVEKSNDSNELGNLYCVESINTCIKKESDIRISNSLCWSPDSTTMYLADSPKNIIYQYDFNASDASLANKRTFVETAAGIDPDGSTIDADGYLWNAQWGGNQIIRYSVNGEQDLIIKTPCSQPTCCCFGGSDMQTLFVTSARDGLSDHELKSQPQAGNLFIYQTPFRGLADTICNISQSRENIK